MVKAIWALAVLASFVFASTMVDIIYTKKAYENSRSQIEAMERLNASISEIQKSISQLSTVIEEALQLEQETPGDERSVMEEGRI